MFIGRIGADMILRLAWNCARRALADVALRTLTATAAGETSCVCVLPVGFDEAIVGVFALALLC